MDLGASGLGSRGPEGKGGEFSREDSFGPLVEVIGCGGERRVVEREKASKQESRRRAKNMHEF